MEYLKIGQFINPTKGFFRHMEYDFGALSTDQLDILFYANYANKNPSPIVTNLLSSDPTEDELIQLADITLRLYAANWGKLKQVKQIGYNPIANYRDQLTETINNNGTVRVIEDLQTIVDITETSNKDNTRTDNLSSSDNKTTTTQSTNTNTDSIYGFNSTGATNTDDGFSNENGSDITRDTLINTGTQKNSTIGTDKSLDSKNSDNTINTSKEDLRVRQSTHEGNIGNLTTQQLLTQEIELWKWNLTQAILENTKDFLTIPVYLS